MSGVYLYARAHLRTCTCLPFFQISGAAGRTALRLGGLLDTHQLSILRKSRVRSIRTAHMRAPFSYLGNSWTDSAEIWCVVIADLWLGVLRVLRVKHIALTHECIRSPFLSNVPSKLGILLDTRYYAFYKGHE